MHFKKKILAAIVVILGLNIFVNDSFAKITYVLDQSAINSPIHKEIDSAMRHAVEIYNTYSDYNIEIPVYYSAEVPTANANNNGRIVFGGSYSNKTAIHEMGHIMGIGTYGAWANLIGEKSRYIGEHGTAMIQSLEGENAILYADKTHFWPHGFNLNYEDAEKHIRLIGAMRKDMGLPDRTLTVSTSADTPSITNMEAIQAPPATATATATQQPNDEELTYQTVLLETVQGKKTMDIAGNNNHDAIISNISTGNSSQRWEKIPTDSGFFQLRNQASGLCLDVAGAIKTLNNDGLVQWSCHTGHNQQWIETKVFNRFSVFTNRKSNRCIQIQNNSRVNGTQFVQYSCSIKAIGQMFRLR